MSEWGTWEDAERRSYLKGAELTIAERLAWLDEMIALAEKQGAQPKPRDAWGQPIDMDRETRIYVDAAGKKRTLSSDVIALVEQQPWHVWAVSYGISHGRVLVLALHSGDFVRSHHLYCEWTERFEGPLEGGPYRLRLREMADDDGTPMLTLSDEAGALLVRCRYARVGTPERLAIPPISSS